MNPLEVGTTSRGLTVEVVEIMSRDEVAASSVTYIDLTDRELTVIPPCLSRMKVRADEVPFNEG